MIKYLLHENVVKLYRIGFANLFNCATVMCFHINHRSKLSQCAPPPPPPPPTLSKSWIHPCVSLGKSPFFGLAASICITPLRLTSTSSCTSETDEAKSSINSIILTTSPWLQLPSTHGSNYDNVGVYY